MTIEQLRARYLHLIRNCLIGTIYDDPPLEFKVEGGVRPFDVGTFRVEPGAGLLSELRVLLGTEAVRIAPLEREGVVVIPQPSGVPTPTG